MKIPLRLATALLVLLPGLAWGWPTGGEKIVVFVTTVKQEGPLQITGFKLPDKVGAAPVLVLRNLSNKQVHKFYVIADIGNLEADSHGEIGPAWSTSTNSTSLDWPQERAIAANSEGEAHENIFRSHLLAGWGVRLHSSCLLIAAIVHSVEFADGTAWHLENHEDQEIWKSSLGSDSTRSCDHSPAMESALKEWGNGSPGNEELGSSGNEGTGTPTHLDTGTVQSYSVTCPLKDVGGRLAAICAW